MKKSVVFGLLLAAALGLGQGVGAQVTQEWVARYPSFGQDEPSAIALDQRDNIYVTGRSMAGSTNYDYLTIKYNSHGIQQWVARYDSGEGANDIAIDEDGNVFVTGVDAAGHFATVKYDSNGNIQWTTSYGGMGNGGGWANDLALDEDNNLVVGGITQGTSTYDFTIIKYNSDGAVIWIATYPDVGYFQLNGENLNLDIDHDRNIFVTGQFTANPSGDEYLTIKYDSQGQLLWSATYDGPMGMGSISKGIAVDDAGNCYVAGESSYSLVFPTYDIKIVTIKYNSNGMVQWIQSYDNPVSGQSKIARWVAGIKVDQSGNIYIAGNHKPHVFYGYDWLTIKYNEAGALQWVRTYTGTTQYGESILKDLAVDLRGNVYVTGESDQLFTAHDITTIKYDQNGNQEWVKFLSSTGSHWDMGSAIAVDMIDHVYVAGWIGLHANDYVTIKYSQSDSLILPSPATSTNVIVATSPNPFNPTTDVRYKIQDARNISLKVYDTAGRLVATLADGWQEAGTHSATFDGSKLAAGVYLVRLEAGGISATQKIVLLK